MCQVSLFSYFQLLTVTSSRVKIAVMNTLLARMQWILENREWTHRQFAEAVGWHPTQISAYLHELKKNPLFAKRISLDTYEKIAKGAKVSLLWLEHGIGSPDRKDLTPPMLGSRQLESVIQNGRGRWHDEVIGFARTMAMKPKFQDLSDKEWEIILDNAESAMSEDIAYYEEATTEEHTRSRVYKK